MHVEMSNHCSIANRLAGGAENLVKALRIIGSVFCVLGFFFALIGILSFVFPLIQNEQFKLILDSFQQSSTDPLTNTLNIIVRFCLTSGYLLLFCGISLMVIGGLTGYIAYRKQLLIDATADNEIALRPISGKISGNPRPAYFPGGMEPTSAVTDFEDISRFSSEPDGKPSNPPFAAPPPAGPISGRIEPAFSSDESDAQKLMRFDQQIKEQSPSYLQYPPNDPEYLNSSAPNDPQNPIDSMPNDPLADSKTEQQGSLDDDPPKKPRIVSTMGKRKP